LAIFITDQVQGGSATVAGLAVSAYWGTKSLLQLPIARWIDKTDGEYDDFWALFIGYMLGGIFLFGYLFATLPWHIYVIQALLGVSMAIATPAWYAIFTRHVDKWRIGFEWSLESVISFGLASAGAAALGGYVVDTFGFRALFIGAASVAVVAPLLLLTLRKHLTPGHKMPDKILPEKKEHRGTASAGR